VPTYNAAVRISCTTLTLTIWTGNWHTCYSCPGERLHHFWFFIAFSLHVIAVNPTTSLTHFTGCACWSEFRTWLPFWFIKSCTDSRRNTLVQSTMSPTCLAADLSVLLAPTVWQCRRLSWQPSLTNRAFPVVGPQTWNDLPDDVTSAESLSTFRQRLKTNLLTKSFFLIIPLDWTSPNLSLVHLTVVFVLLRPL